MSRAILAQSSDNSFSIWLCTFYKVAIGLMYYNRWDGSWHRRKLVCQTALRTWCCHSPSAKRLAKNSAHSRLRDASWNETLVFEMHSRVSAWPVPSDHETGQAHPSCKSTLFRDLQSDRLKSALGVFTTWDGYMGCKKKLKIENKVDQRSIQNDPTSF